MISPLDLIRPLDLLTAARAPRRRAPDRPRPAPRAQGAGDRQRAKSCASATWSRTPARPPTCRCSARPIWADRRRAGRAASPRRCAARRSSALDTGGLTEVVVTRAGARASTAEDIDERDRAALAGQYGSATRRTSPSILDRGVRSMHVEPTRVTATRGRAHELSIRATAASTSPSSCPAARWRAGRLALHRHASTETVEAADADAGRSTAARSSRRPTSRCERRPKTELRGDGVAGRTRRSAWPPGARCAAGQALRDRRPGQARDRAAQRNRHHHLRGARHHADRARQGAGSRRASATSSACSTSNRTAPCRPRSPDRAASASRRGAAVAADRRRGSRHRPSIVSSHASERSDDHAIASRRAARLSATVGALRPLLGGCAAVDRLAMLGEPPPLSAIENPTTQPGYKPVHMPMPTPQPAPLQPELAVAERLARLLQGSARAPGRRHPHRHGQSQRQGGDRQRDPAQPREQGGLPASPTSSAAKTTAKILRPRPCRPHPHCRFHCVERRQGLGQPLRGAGHQRRRRGHPGAAERQPRGRGQAGGPRQLRDPRIDRRRHRPAGGHPERQHHRFDARSPRRGSPTAAAARSPTCSSRVTASRCSTCCCRSEVKRAPAPTSRSRTRDGDTPRPPAAPRLGAVRFLHFRVMTPFVKSRELLRAMRLLPISALRPT